MAKKSLQDLTKSELYEKAQKADVPGRSQMSRTELIKALSNGHAQERPTKSRKRAQAATTKRSIWSGAITFGLITIPVGLYTATEDRDIAFHLLSGKDKSRIQYKRVSSKTGREVDWDDIVKGYEYEKGKYVVFTPEELEQIAPESARTIDVVKIVDATEIDPIYFEKSYFVAPSKVGAKAYKLFLRALTESGRVAVAKVTIREKERLCTLRVKEDLLVLETMTWPDEIRVPDFEQLKDNSRISAEELKMARLLIDHLAGEFDPSEFEDSYRQRLEDAIDAKIEGNEIELAPAAAEPATVTNLLDALKASVDQTRAKRSA
ncbi:MAG TPA: Ku protein [Acidimicrobiia bacterium]|nr:Ku protein [Acidimicrobiia bacterium]